MLLIDYCVFVFTEKEERIKKEKEQGTYKEKVSAGDSHCRPNRVDYVT